MGAVDSFFSCNSKDICGLFFFVIFMYHNLFIIQKNIGIFSCSALFKYFFNKIPISHCQFAPLDPSFQEIFLCIAHYGYLCVINEVLNTVDTRELVSYPDLFGLKS